LSKTIRWLLVFILLWAIYRRLEGEAFRLFFEQLPMAWTARKTWLAVAVLLMPANWLLETAKWQTLMVVQNRQPGFRQAFRAVMTGLALSLFTPARLGDYLGRSLQAGPFGKWRAAGATLLGHIAQWLLLLATGLPALLLLKTPNHLPTNAPLMLFALTALAGTFFYLSLPRWIPKARFLKKYKGLHRLTKHLPQTAAFPSQTHLAKALILGSLRYGVFSLQLYALLLFFGLPLSPKEGLAGIWCIFLLQSGLPLPFIGNVLLRTELAAWIWPHSPTTAILAGMSALFALNLALPALLGASFLVQINEQHHESYESHQTENHPATP